MWRKIKGVSKLGHPFASVNITTVEIDLKQGVDASTPYDETQVYLRVRL